MFCCGMVMVYLTHMFEDYFAGIRSIVWLPLCQRSNHENVSKYFTWIHWQIWYNENLCDMCKFYIIYCTDQSRNFMAFIVDVCFGGDVWLLEKYPIDSLKPLIGHPYFVISDKVVKSHFGGRVPTYSILVHNIQQHNDLKSMLSC